MKRTTWVIGIVLLAMALCVCVVQPVFAGGGLDVIQWDPTYTVWSTTALNNNTYTALTHDGVRNYYIYAARSNGLDVIQWDSAYGWSKAQISANAYTNLVCTKMRSYFAFGTRASGLDTIQWDSEYGWSIGQISANVYTALAPEPFRTDTQYIYGAQSGGLDAIQCDPSTWQWPISQLDSGAYASIAHDAVSLYYVYGAAADGLYSMQYDDQVTYSWVKNKINSNAYTYLVADTVTPYCIYGARAGGGLDVIQADTVTWQWTTTTINDNTYTALASDGLWDHYLYGARAGSLDVIQWDSVNGWTTAQVNAKTYRALSSETGRAQYFYGAVLPPPTPGTLSGQITLADYHGDPFLIPVRVEFIENGSTVRTEEVRIDPNPGQYTIAGISPGNYNVAFTAGKSLRQIVQNVNIPDGGQGTANVTLVNGDIDGDNQVTGTDINAVLPKLDQKGD